MTRRLERRIESLEDDRPEKSLTVKINRELVVTRERAEREGRTILGEADTPGDTEHVRVDPFELTSGEKEMLDAEFSVDIPTASDQ